MIDNCPVCYEHIAEHDTLPCGHNIHGTCIISSGKAQCPICRCTLPQYLGKVVELSPEPTEWGLIDKLVAFGWLKHTDIPIIDNLELAHGNNLLLVKAVLLLYVIKLVIGSP